MIRNLVSATLLAALLMTGWSAQAATVNLLPSAVVGGSFSLDLELLAGDAPGASPGTFSGQVLITFDSDLAQFTDYTPNGSSGVFLGPVLGGDSSVTTVLLGFNDFTSASPVNEGVIGSFNFTTDAPIDTVINFALEDGFILGSFVNEDPSDAPFFPNFNGTSVQVVPLPAAAWLLAGGLGWLGVFARRRST